MAQLAFGIVGGVIGAYFGMPQLGFVLGSIVGGVVAASMTKTPGQVGPRIGDLSVMSSTFGAPQPICYGTFRMAGNMIWSLPLIETTVTSKVQSAGKGSLSPAQTSTTYVYYASFAVLFAVGPAQSVIRLWADKKLIYDARPASVTVFPGLSFRFYPGTETQMPDPIIEDNVGTAFCPANRGNVVIVFDTLPVAVFGNRIPSIEAEIAFKSETQNFSRIATPNTEGIFNAVNGSAMGVDRVRRNIYMIGSGPDFTDGLRVFNMDTLAETRQSSSARIYGSELPGIGGGAFNFDGGFTVGSSGYIYSGVGDQNFDPVLRIDPNSLKIDQVFGDFGSSSGDIPATWACAESAGAAELNEKGETHTPLYLACLGVPSGDITPFTIVSGGTNPFQVADGAIPHGTAETLGAPPVMQFVHARGIVSDANIAATADNARWWVGDQDSAGGNSDLRIYRITIDTGIEFIVRDTIPASQWENNAASGTFVTGPIIDANDSGLIFLVAPSDGGCYVFKWVDGQGVVWMSRTVTAYPFDTNTICGQSLVNASRFGFIGALSGSGIGGALIDTSTGEILMDGEVTVASGFTLTVGGTQFYDGPSQSVYVMLNSAPVSILGQVYLARVTAQTTTLDLVTADICQRSGLKPAQIDVSRLASTEVIGYALASQMAGSDAIAPLMAAFFFDIIETNGKVTFIPRGTDATKTITKSQLMFIDDSSDTNDVVTETRIQEWELPQSMSVNFIDPDLDYQPNSVASSRTGSPMAGTIALSSPDAESFQVPQITVGSFGAQTASIPVVMTATQAAQLCEALLYTTWNERMTESFRADSSLLGLDPTDVINIDLENGTVLQVRITKATTNIDFSTSFDALKQDKVTVVSTKISTGGALGLPQQVPPGNGITQLFVFDIPLLRDADDTGGLASKLYIGMNGYSGNWPGGILWRALDGQTYAPTGTRITLGCTYGILEQALPATDYPFQTDRVTQMQVFLNEGFLSSVTTSEFLNDENVALVGDPALGNWEVIEFQNAVQQDDGSYILTNIMRGRRGTEVNCNTHGDGEFFIVPDRATFGTYLMTIAGVNVATFFRGVGNTQIVENANTITITPRGNDLKPYAPCHLDATVGSGGSPDITLTWVRRNRTIAQLQDNTGTIPMTEATESYSIDILDSMGAVKRTLTATSATVTYTNADAVADFAGIPTTLAFAVYQISAVVGRGFQSLATITL